MIRLSDALETWEAALHAYSIPRWFVMGTRPLRVWWDCIDQSWVINCRRCEHKEGGWLHPDRRHPVRPPPPDQRARGVLMSEQEVMDLARLIAAQRPGARYEGGHVTLDDEALASVILSAGYSRAAAS